MKKQYRKSDLNIIDDGNIKLLTNKHRGLLDCELSIITEENVELIYSVKGESLEDCNYKKYEKLQIIYRLAMLVANELKPLDFSLSPDNVFVTIDGSVHIYERKISNIANEIKEARLLNELIALSGFMLRGMEFETLLEVDNSQLETDKELKEMLELRSLDELCIFLEQLTTKELETLHNERIIINKRKYKNLTTNKLFYRVSLVVSIIMIIALSAYVIPHKAMEIKLYEAAQDSDSTTILEIVQDINISSMSKNEKIVASTAIINDQVELNDAQKANIISQLNNKTKDEILDYWMYIGKGEYDEANNKAIAVSDADMQTYALLLLINQTQNDDKLEADERKQLIDGYEGQIKDLTDQKEKVNGDTNE